MRRRLVRAFRNPKPGAKISFTAAEESRMPLGLESIAQIKWVLPDLSKRDISDTSLR
jgi:hypothetical protein